jgi:hypothetical protein
MNPSSLNVDFWLRRAKGSAVQSQKDMYKLSGSELIDDEGCSYRVNLLAVFASSLRSVRRAP